METENVLPHHRTIPNNIKSSLPGKVTIIEVGPRDGFQSIRQFIGTDDKVSIIKELCGTGLSRIEITSFVNPRAVPQMADAAEVVKRLAVIDNVRFMVLVPNLKGAELAINAGAREINMVMSASESHNMSNCRKTIAESLKEFESAVKPAKAAGCRIRASLAVSFGCPFEGKISPARVAELVKALHEKGAEEIQVSDTTGMGNPFLIQEVISHIRDAAKNADIVTHLHNTRETGMANILAALLMGVSKMETSVGGLGGCPFAPGATGNVATEDVVNMLDDMGIETGVDLNKLIGCAKRIRDVLGFEIYSGVAKAGPTYSGITGKCSI